MKKLHFTLFTLILICRLQAMDMQTLKAIHAGGLHDIAWINFVCNNPDKVTLEVLESSYLLEKDKLHNPQLLEIEVRGRETIRRGSQTSFLLNEAILGYIKQLKNTPDTEHNKIINNIVTLCTSYYFNITPKYARYGINHLAQTPEQYPLIHQNSILHAMITELGNND